MNLLREALSKGWFSQTPDGGVSLITACHTEMDFEPLHGYPPYEELIKPKD